MPGALCTYGNRKARDDAKIKIKKKQIKDPKFGGMGITSGGDPRSRDEVKMGVKC